MPMRKLTAAEERFLEFMIEEADMVLPKNWKQLMWVTPMDNGNMGSLMLYPDGMQTQKRDFGKFDQGIFTEGNGFNVIKEQN